MTSNKKYQPPRSSRPPPNPGPPGVMPPPPPPPPHVKLEQIAKRLAEMDTIELVAVIMETIDVISRQNESRGRRIRKAVARLIASALAANQE
jgi:hypothetical protein